ncbi:uncharacterized protein PHACADRAFT_183446 [Phanerochaete carnosa HHB-10118-sp]|uniref:Uncharacterized protein n=1 Tax=Phanerochaete carnosa (strain HHB-10118-sp) TaxID=650164 RepID=K5WCC6_PHACS|nr:uncharacterized protein PHACADRAFT_183446 [Phanerochaete carnosa HHB-10118-sp]EKM56870.1 hypothetical protein PHACADRAFT_183446 [Phanerochaete carnosa HHB-10118-sp]
MCVNLYGRGTALQTLAVLQVMTIIVNANREILPDPVSTRKWSAGSSSSTDLPLWLWVRSARNCPPLSFLSFPLLRSYSLISLTSGKPYSLVSCSVIPGSLPSSVVARASTHCEGYMAQPRNGAHRYAHRCALHRPLPNSIDSQWCASVIIGFTSQWWEVRLPRLRGARRREPGYPVYYDANLASSAVFGTNGRAVDFPTCPANLSVESARSDELGALILDR